jgi:hypothetical protein
VAMNASRVTAWLDGLPQAKTPTWGQDTILKFYSAKLFRQR